MTTLEHHPAEHALDDDEREHIWQHGYTAGLDAQVPATCFVPVTITWRHALPGDAFLGEGNTIWHVQALDEYPALDVRNVRAVCGAQTFDVTVRADEAVTVLDAATERDAATLLAEHLGARLIARRRGGDPVTR